jgi:16S rRNA (cytosine967-C5)-methyltransferase
MIAPARIAAFDILVAVSAGNVDLPTALAASRPSLPDDRDRGLVAEIATGTLRWRAALDHLIVAFSRRAIDRLDREVVEILRLSTYQLLHLTRVPASAVVDDAVELTRRAGKRSATGFVNAILRSVSRNRKALPLPPRPESEHDRDAVLDYFSIALSHPRWLVARWYDRLGFDATERWLRYNNTPAVVTLRANRLRFTREELTERLAEDGVVVSPAAFAPDGLTVVSGHPLRGGGAEAGAFVVQDEASQLVALLAGAAPGARVLDACASPGGKATAIAAAMDDSAMLIACDVRARRVELLRRTVVNSGAPNIRIVQSDLLHSLPFSSPFDLVFVDAPCSGLGTLRRDPDIKWRRTESDLPVLAAAALTMLQNAAEAVTPGGRLVYATCSSEPDENEGVIDAFLATTPAFAPIDVRSSAPGVPRSLVDERGHLKTAPHRDALDAFFGAVFERRVL